MAENVYEANRQMCQQIVGLLYERDRLREALLTMVDVIAYLHPNPNSPHAKKWAEWREQALDKAATALGPGSEGENG